MAALTPTGAHKPAAPAAPAMPAASRPAPAPLPYPVFGDGVGYDVALQAKATAIVASRCLELLAACRAIGVCLAPDDVENAARLQHLAVARNAAMTTLLAAQEVGLRYLALHNAEQESKAWARGATAAPGGQS